MPAVSVNCNNCGSPLEVGDSTRFVTCGHCGSRLEVKRTASSAYTEMLGEIAQNTGAIADHMADLAREKEIERIDREWAMERSKYAGKDGHVAGPATSLLMAVLVGAFGVFWVGGAASIGAPGPFLLFGVVFTILGVGGGIRGVVTWEEFKAAEARYQQRRAAALNRQPPAG